MSPNPTVLRDGAVYFSDNGRLICRKCAGTSALYTGRDISGQRVERVDVAAVRYFRDLGLDAKCESGCLRLSSVAGPDSWPAVLAP